MSLEYITSKNLFLLICDTLRLINAKVVDHGTRVGYILIEMLQRKGGYEKFELADLLLLAIMHDIGAYKTDEITDELAYDIKGTMPHSIYGYLFLKYLSPQEEMSKVILYHHVGAKKMAQSTYPHIDIADYLAVAEIVDIFSMRYGDKFDYKILEKYVGKRFTKDAYALMVKTAMGSNMFEKIQSGEYQKDIEDLLEYVLFSDHEKEKYLKMLMYLTGLRSEYSVVDTVAAICISREIAAHMGIGELEQKEIYYGALLHDVGMLAIPMEILNSPRRLTEEEIALVRTHVEKTEQLLTGKLSDDIVRIACRHHERLDGSGYPKKIKGKQINSKQAILQVADTVVGMTNERAYRQPKTKDEVIEILLEEVNEGHFNDFVVNTFIDNYDKIMEKVKARSEVSLVMHKKLATQYEKVYSLYDNLTK